MAAIIQRKVAEYLAQFTKNKGEFNNILLVEGARQVGKTTLIRTTLTHLDLPYKELNLEAKTTFTEKIDRVEDFTHFTELLEVETGFRPGGEAILFIDEAQESRRLGGFVRFMKEQWRHTQVILSGSSMSRIFRDDTRYPVGRVTPLLVQPFSFEEFLAAVDQQRLVERLTADPAHWQMTPPVHQRLLEWLDQYLDVGGLPEVVTTFAAHGDWAQLRENLLLGYYHDFKRVYGETRQAYFVAALRTTAHLLGTAFKNSHVAALLDGGKNAEIIHALSQLEAWKMAIRVDQRGTAVETHYHAKRYLFETGLAKQLREMAIPRIHLLKTLDAAGRTALGGLLENVVANIFAPHMAECTGWKKSSSGSEVDFVVKQHGQVIPIECKAALTIKNSHLGGVRDFLRIHRARIGIVIALAPYEIRQFSDQERIIILPLYLAEQWETALRQANN